MESITALLKRLAYLSQAHESFRLGITGPPGVGKSSLVASLARTFRRSDVRVGVLAVDPSSPRSGGALLGDRARIDPDSSDSGIFVRSMASAGDLGGLSRAAMSAVDVLSASHDIVIIETVGVGQSEVDIECAADATVVVVQPASGDTLQFLKAGILEIPDVFVVNKADLGEVAERALRELEASLRAVRGGRREANGARVFSTSATTGLGMQALADGLRAVHAELRDAGQVPVRRHRGSVVWTERGILRLVGEIGVAALGGRSSLRDQIDSSLRLGHHPIEVVRMHTAKAVAAIRCDAA